MSGSVNDDRTLRTNEVDRTGRLGIDVKWGVRADLTLDATVNTDFAQVEADEEQVNLTRFALVFPEKRPFFLENAQLFQVGQPQGVDLFFSRRIGLDPTGQPIDILGGARLSGKLGGGYNVGLLNSDRPGLRPSDRRASGSCQQLYGAACSARLAAPTSAGSSSTARAPGVWRRPTTSIAWPRCGVANLGEWPPVRLCRAHRFARQQGRLRLRRPCLLQLCRPCLEHRGGLFTGGRQVQP